MRTLFAAIAALVMLMASISCAVAASIDNFGIAGTVTVGGEERTLYALDSSLMGSEWGNVELYENIPLQLPAGEYDLDADGVQEMSVDWLIKS